MSRSPDTVRAADAAFVALDRLPPSGQRSGFLDLAPDLVVEVVSPTDRAGDLLAKTLAWLAAGTREVWVVHPAARTVAVHTPDGGDEHVGTDGVLTGHGVVPGFEVLVADLFA